MAECSGRVNISGNGNPWLWVGTCPQPAGACDPNDNAKACRPAFQPILGKAWTYRCVCAAKQLTDDLSGTQAEVEKQFPQPQKATNETLPRVEVDNSNKDCELKVATVTIGGKLNVIAWCPAKCVSDTKGKDKTCVLAFKDAVVPAIDGKNPLHVITFSCICMAKKDAPQ